MKLYDHPPLDVLPEPLRDPQPPALRALHLRDTGAPAARCCTSVRIRVGALR